MRAALLAALIGSAIALGACASGESDADRVSRGADAVAACQDHDGVAAFDDDAVICEDGTARDERGVRAVEACQDRDGVSAFDDDIVICRDGSFHEAAGG
jgi:hypothetical protein